VVGVSPLSVVLTTIGHSRDELHVVVRFFGDLWQGWSEDILSCN
jgi:hypothetical protein